MLRPKRIAAAATAFGWAAFAYAAQGAERLAIPWADLTKIEYIALVDHFGGNYERLLEEDREYTRSSQFAQKRMRESITQDITKRQAAYRGGVSIQFENLPLRVYKYDFATKQFRAEITGKLYKFDTFDRVYAGYLYITFPDAFYVPRNKERIHVPVGEDVLAESMDRASRAGRLHVSAGCRMVFLRKTGGYTRFPYDTNAQCIIDTFTISGDGVPQKVTVSAPGGRLTYNVHQ